jgi:site-specific DNA-methyltransferase (adenine-specific)
MEYLIKTYTNENETVLDFTMGSGTTGVACINTNRNFIGIELDEDYFKIAEERIQNAQKEKAELENV